MNAAVTVYSKPSTATVPIMGMLSLLYPRRRTEHGLRAYMKLPLIPYVLAGAIVVGSADLPTGYWPEARSAEILDSTETIRLAPDISPLDAGEQAAVKELLQVGRIMQRLYEDSRHPQALNAYDALVREHERRGRPKATQNLLTLYYLFQGPIATTLDNTREAFLPVAPQAPGRNVYPADVSRAEIDAFLTAQPQQRDMILGERTLVRRATRENLERDLAALRKGALATLHAQVGRALESLAKAPDSKVLYAVPYAVGYAADLGRAFTHLMTAAAHIEGNDPEFARYLRNRARDLLSNDYESGDASWVTGRFRRLNAQIGAYETYDDPMYGLKAFHSLSLLMQNEPATLELRKRLAGLQDLENALPYEPRKRVKEDISVGVYDVIADFGQARGTNTATILPNDPLFSRRYGRTILMRENILKDPQIFAADTRVWRAATANAHGDELTSEGAFQRTLWHEVGHYLGVERDKSGRALDVALEEYADALEEMKADLVSLFVVDAMSKTGKIDNATLRAVQASGIRRVVQGVQPRQDQPYQMMQLAQFNYFLDTGLLVADPSSARLSISYERYSDTISALLREVLQVQHSGDTAVAAKFFEKWGAWTPELHEKLGARVRAAQGARYRIVRYAALDD